MKFLSLGLFIAFLAPAALQAAVREDAENICSIVDRYVQGSYHYFDCLNHIESIDPNFSLDETIDFVCSAVDTFYSLDSTHKELCYKNAKAKLNPEPLACYPSNNVLSDRFKLPAGFDAALAAEFKDLAGAWKDAYREKVEGANNSLTTDLQSAKDGCFSEGYGVSLDGDNPLKDALIECVFTNINAYSGPAISLENQKILADQFVEKHGDQYRFRKIYNASVQEEPIAAFNTRCVLEISKNFEDQRLYLAGHTWD